MVGSFSFRYRRPVNGVDGARLRVWSKERWTHGLFGYGHVYWSSQTHRLNLTCFALWTFLFSTQCLKIEYTIMSTYNSHCNYCIFNHIIKLHHNKPPLTHKTFLTQTSEKSTQNTTEIHYLPAKVQTISSHCTLPAYSIPNANSQTVTSWFRNSLHRICPLQTNARIGLFTP